MAIVHADGFEAYGAGDLSLKITSRNGQQDVSFNVSDPNGQNLATFPVIVPKDGEWHKVSMMVMCQPEGTRYYGPVEVEPFGGEDDRQD